MRGSEFVFDSTFSFYLLSLILGIWDIDIDESIIQANCEFKAYR